MPHGPAGNLAHADQHDAGARLPPDRAIRPMELGLAVWKAKKLGVGHDDLMKPIRRGSSGTQCDAVAMGEEFAQPGYVSGAPAKRWIHKYEAVPRLAQAVVCLGEDLPRGHPMPRPGRAWVKIELEAQRCEDSRRREPIG